MPPRRSKEKVEREDHDIGSSLPMDQEGRKKALESALDDLTKRFGDGAVVRLGDAAHLTIDTIPSGSLTVDIALGVGGMPRGRVVEVYGPESSGKTTLCLHVIAEAQKRGGLAAFVDMEHALDPSYARRLGVNVDTLYVSQPDTAEQALEIMESLVRSGALDVVVLDSVAALVPRVEIEGEMGESHVGVQARLMSQALRKLSGAIKQSNVCVLFTNQIREKIGVMYGCVGYDAPVMLADGTKRRIGEIVNQRQPVEVMSYNVETRAFEAKPVVEWFKNGQPVEQFSMTDNEIGRIEQEFLTFITSYPDGSGHRRVTTTPNHEIATPNGFQLAEDIDLGEMVLGRMEVDCPTDDPANPIRRETHVVPMRVTEIRRKLLRGKRAVKYNLQVAGNANYLVSDIIVHNSPETQPGGRALKFYASVRLDVRKLESIKASGDEVIGSRVRVRVTKNKVAPPFREAEFDIMYLEGGISKTGEVLDLATDLGIVEKRGAFYRYNEGLLGQGRENSKTFLRENIPLRDEIENKVRERYGLPVSPVTAPPANGTD